MKTHCTILATILPALCMAAIPVAWTNAPGMPTYALDPVPHGVPVDFSVTLKGYTPIAPGADVRLWFQTNGMGAAWWSAPASHSSNAVTASFGPAQDCGADRVNLFFGAPSNVFASAVLRLTHSPGFVPNSLPLPAPVLDFGAVELRGLAALTNGWSFGSDADLSPATNYTAAALGAFAGTGSVARAASCGTPARWTDATGCVWQVEAAHYSDWSFAGVPEGYVFGLEWLGYAGAWKWTLEQWGGGEDYAQDYFYADDDTDTELSIDVGADFFAGTITCSRTYYPYGTNLAGRVAYTNDLPDTDAIGRELDALRTESALIYRLYSGSNVVAEVTNYNSQVHAPELRLMQLNESNEYVTVWAETNGLARVRREANAYTDAATGAVARAAAPRAWSKTTSALGADAPDGVTWVSTPTVVVAGGLEYAKHVTSAGAVWVLASNGLVADVAGATNAFFRIADESGTNVLFAVERTESLSIGVDASNIAVAAVGDGNDVAIQIPVVSREHPVCYAATNLTDWAAVAPGAEPEWIGMCEWNGEPGAWEFIAGGVVARQAFFRFMVEQDGSTVIRHAAATDISAGIVVNGTNFVPKVTGNTLTWEKAQ